MVGWSLSPYSTGETKGPVLVLQVLPVTEGECSGIPSCSHRWSHTIMMVLGVEQYIDICGRVLPPVKTTSHSTAFPT